MPRGVPQNWTLDQLRRIAERKDVSAEVLAIAFGCAYSTIYSLQKQITDAGSPEALFDQMQERAANRYGRGTRRGVSTPKALETLAYALQKVYLLRIGAAGRGGAQPQVTVTIPGAIAYPFMEVHGTEVMFELREEGILIKPTPVLKDELPSWFHQEPLTPGERVPRAQPSERNE